MRYAKAWLSIDDQIDLLVQRGLLVSDRGRAAALLNEVGYYRLTGYLYALRESRTETDSDGHDRVLVLDRYRGGTRIEDAARLLDFDRRLRLLVLEGVERIEVALRMRLGYTLGKYSAFAHEDPTLFTAAFTTKRTDTPNGTPTSGHDEWLARAERRRDDSDEAFVAHFQQKYEGRMPVWALTELLELGHIARLYRGLRNDIAIDIADEFRVPTKKLLSSWLAAVTYVRNVAAHHGRLFNRRLTFAPRRPRNREIPLLAHLSDEKAPKPFGTYSALAVIAYILRSILPQSDWAPRVAAHLRGFPATGELTNGSIGVATGWLDEELWMPRY